MATSGTVTYESLSGEVIKDALYTLNAIPLGTEPDTDTLAFARRALNRLMLEWQAEGMNLWKIDRTSQALVAGTASYAQPLGTLDILSEDIFVRNSAGQDYSVQLISRREYVDLPQKTQQGRPTLLYVERNTVNTSGSHAFQGGITIYPWPVPASATDTLYFTRIRKLDDVTRNSQDVDFSTNWQDALVFNLAYKLSFSYGLPSDKRRDLKKEADDAKQKVRNDDKERGGVWFKPMTSYGIR